VISVAAAGRADAVFHALGDPTRRAIVGRLVRRPATISELADALSITKTAVGQHIALLERCALARSSKLGRVRTCEFDPGGFLVLQDWIDYHRSEWTDRLDRLRDVIAEDHE
jgi:DNA-binding transcriptional ArsR family regulator